MLAKKKREMVPGMGRKQRVLWRGNSTTTTTEIQKQDCVGIG